MTPPFTHFRDKVYRKYKNCIVTFPLPLQVTINSRTMPKITCQLFIVLKFSREKQIVTCPLNVCLWLIFIFVYKCNWSLSEIMDNMERVINMLINFLRMDKDQPVELNRNRNFENVDLCPYGLSLTVLKSNQTI